MLHPERGGREADAFETPINILQVFDERPVHSGILGIDQMSLIHEDKVDVAEYRSSSVDALDCGYGYGRTGFLLVERGTISGYRSKRPYLQKFFPILFDQLSLRGKNDDVSVWVEGESLEDITCNDPALSGCGRCFDAGIAVKAHEP